MAGKLKSRFKGRMSPKMVDQMDKMKGRLGDREATAKQPPAARKKRKK